MVEQQIRASLLANLTDRRLWLRLVYMLILAIARIVAEVALFAMVVLRFLFKLFTGQNIGHLTAFSDVLADYMAEIVRFETFVSEDRAFPFGPWPSFKRGRATERSSPSAKATDSLKTGADSKSENAVKSKSARPRSTRRSTKRKSDSAQTST